jgi:uncharacterized repeat protein (TIGR02543 family)
VPSTGYRFVSWSDSSTDNPRTDTNVTGDITVTANFESLPATPRSSPQANKAKLTDKVLENIPDQSESDLEPVESSQETTETIGSRIASTMPKAISTTANIIQSFQSGIINGTISLDQANTLISQISALVRLIVELSRLAI